MTEPTYRQHKLLEGIQSFGGKVYIKDSDEKKLDMYWELVRVGYLKNLAGVSGWTFVVTEQAEEYLESINS